jgi:hypothetical protein
VILDTRESGRRTEKSGVLRATSARIGIGLFTCLFLAFPAQGAERSYLLRWIAPEGPVSGYVVYMGQESGAYVYQFEFDYREPDADGIDSYLMEGLASSVDYYVAMIAWNEAGDSNLSNEIMIPAVAPVTSDFTGDSSQDILIRHTSGAWYLYALDGAGGISSSGGLNLTANTAWTAVSTSDFDGDGVRDVLIRHAEGAWYLYYLNPDRTVKGGKWLSLTGNTDWRPLSTADFTGDDNPDLLIRHTSGSWVLYELDASQNVTSVNWPRLTTNMDWGVVATTDVNGDGYADIVLRHTAGSWATYLTDGAGDAQAVIWPGFTPNTSWQIIGLNDFNGDGIPDVLLRHATYGHWYVYHLDTGMNVTSSGYLPLTSNLSWRAVSIEDFNGDGNADVMVRHSGGAWNQYTLDGALGIQNSAFVPMAGNTAWSMVSGNTAP